MGLVLWVCAVLIEMPNTASVSKASVTGCVTSRSGYFPEAVIGGGGKNELFRINLC